MVHAGWWWPSSAAALLLVLLCCTVSCASTLDLAIISSNNNDALPRRPAPVVRHADDRRGADSDGITRTPGSNCHSSDGVTCDLCCNGICCEDFSGTSSDSIPTSHRVGLRFNVISADNATYASIMTPTADGRFPSRVHQNVATLNRVFNPILNVWFYVEAIVPWTDPRMVASCNTDPCYQSVACDFYTYTLPTVRRDSSKVINVIVADQIGYLGESQWPWASVEDSPYQYVEVHAKTVGVSAPGWPTGLGYTLVHEMGHYFGLLHVFERQGHCDVVNDWVDDTPTSLNPANREQDCNTPVDSCPSLPGNDDINNFMNYARDECMTEGFTRGQQARLRQGARRYRPLLMAATAVSDGITCSVNATTLCECVPSSCGGTLVPSSPPTTTPPSSASTPPTTATPTSTSTTPASTVMPNATTTMGGSSNSSDSIIGGVVGAAIIVIVISGICVCARARRQRVLAAGYAPPLPTPTKLTADKLRTFDTLPPPVLSSTTMVSEDSDAHFQVQVDDNRPLTTTNGSPHAAKAPSRTAVVVELIPSTTPTSTRVGPLAQTEWSDDEKAVSPTLQLQTSVTVTGKAPSSDVNTGLQRFAGFQRRDEEPAHRADGEVATTSGGDRRDGASSLNSSSLHTATSVARTARQHSRVASATSDVLRTPRSHAETDEIGPASVNLSFGE